MELRGERGRERKSCNDLLKVENGARHSGCPALTWTTSLQWPHLLLTTECFVLLKGPLETLRFTEPHLESETTDFIPTPAKLGSGSQQSFCLLSRLSPLKMGVEFAVLPPPFGCPMYLHLEEWSMLSL